MPSVAFNGSVLPLDDLPLSATLADLANRINDLTRVPPSNQKLIFKGRKATPNLDTTLEQAGIRPNSKLVLIGQSVEQVSAFAKKESEAQRRDTIIAQRNAAGPSKVRGTTLATTSQYRFDRIVALSHLPNPQEASAVLTKLANDPAIRHVMSAHKFRVGVLTELAPHEHPHLLGLNENAGHAIKLRLRTDEYDGFRLYAETRRVLLHELTHNVWGPHDDNFKSLNSELNREVAGYEASLRASTHTLGSFGTTFDAPDANPGEDLTGITGGVNILGGAPTGPPSSVEERRARVFDAATRRLREQEAEIEDRCAT